MAGTKLIVDVDDVRERLSLPDIAEINDAIAAGLTSAHVFFAAAVGTTFEENTACDDIFYLNTNLHSVRPNGQFRLRLKKAFVKPSGIAVTYASSRVAVLDPTQAVAVPSTDYVVDTDKGLVYIDDIDMRQYNSDVAIRLPFDNYGNKYVRVQYQAGFGPTTGVNPPEWLREAVLAWMPSALLVKSDDVDKQMKTALGIRQLAAAMVEPYKRESVFNFAPIY